MGIASNQTLCACKQCDDQADRRRLGGRSSHRSEKTAPEEVTVAYDTYNSRSPMRIFLHSGGPLRQQLGLRVVAITNVAYSKSVASQHSSGKHLFEVAEVVIDNCGVVGDAALDMEGLDTRAIPTSGLTFCYIIWALTAEAIAQMHARGLKPHVYRSVNLPDGEAYNTRAEAEYRETGV